MALLLYVYRRICSLKDFETFAHIHCKEYQPTKLSILGIEVTTILDIIKIGRGISLNITQTKKCLEYLVILYWLLQSGFEE